MCGSPEKERTLEEWKSPRSVKFKIFEHMITEALISNKAPKRALSLSNIFKAKNTIKFIRICLAEYKKIESSFLNQDKG